MLWIGESLIDRGRGRTVKDVIGALQKITPADIKRVAKHVLNEKKYNLALVGPVTDEQDKALRKLLKV